MTTPCNACLGSGEITYDTTNDFKSWDDIGKTPCPICQATTTLEVGLGTLDYLAHEYFREVMDTAEGNRLTEIFSTALAFNRTIVTIPATEEMVEQFQEFLDGARP